MSELGVVKRMKSIDEIFGLDKTIVDIETEKLVEFEEHPFKFKDDEEFQGLVRSIGVNGIIDPIIVREKGKQYEILAGHRKTRAAIENGMKTVPAIINNVDDNAARMIAVDTNFESRKKFLPSEKARAYLMRNEVLLLQGKRNDLTNEEKGRWTELAKSELKGGHTQIARYIRLNYLIDGLLDMVDENMLTIKCAPELSYLKSEHQEIVYSIIKTEGIKITEGQAVELKEKKDILDNDFIKELLTGKIPVQRKKITIPYKKIREYFSDNQSDEDIITIILEILKKYKS